VKPLEQQTLKDAHRALEDLTSLMAEWGTEPSEEQYAHAANLAAHLTSSITASDHHRRFADGERLSRTGEASWPPGQVTVAKDFDVVRVGGHIVDELEVVIEDLRCDIGRKTAEIAKREKQLEECRHYADKLADALRWIVGDVGRVLNGDPVRNIDENIAHAERLVADHQLMRIESPA
jgi:hypothetical protein